MNRSTNSGTTSSELKQTDLDGLLGDTYQAFLAMNVFVEAVIRKLEKLELEREVKGLGALDDIVYHTGDRNYILVQAKHKTSSFINAIQGSNLISDFNDDYSLVKYIWSYCEAENTYKNIGASVKQSFIFTNISLNVKDVKPFGEVIVSKKQKGTNKMKKLSIKCTKFNYNSIDTSDILYLQTETHKEPKVEFYQFEYESTKSTLLDFISTFKPSEKDKDKLKLLNDETIKDALLNIVYAVNQPNEASLSEIIKNKIKQNFKLISPDIVFNKLKIQLLDWLTRKSIGFPLIITYDTAKQFFNENLKLISFDVIAPISSFVGRTNELKIIKEKLQSSKAAVISQTIKINGQGGIGKTELSRQYVKLYQEDYYGRVVFINAESKKSIEISFKSLAEYLKLSDELDVVGGSRKRKHNIDTNSTNLEDRTKMRIRLIIEYFVNVRVLFVFDNAVKYEGEEQGDHIRFFRTTLNQKQ